MQPEPLVAEQLLPLQETEYPPPQSALHCAEKELSGRVKVTTMEASVNAVIVAANFDKSIIILFTSFQAIFFQKQLVSQRAKLFARGEALKDAKRTLERFLPIAIC